MVEWSVTRQHRKTFAAVRAPEADARGRRPVHDPSCLQRSLVQQSLAQQALAQQCLLEQCLLKLCAARHGGVRAL